MITLARQIATTANLPLQQLDLLQYETGGAMVRDEELLRRHTEVLAGQRWVVGGFGTPHAFEAMLRAADILVDVERSSLSHARLLALRPGKRVYVVRRKSDVNSLLVELVHQATSGEARPLARPDSNCRFTDDRTSRSQ